MTHIYNLKIDTGKKTVSLMQPVEGGMANVVKIDYTKNKLKHALSFASDLIRETIQQGMIDKARFDNSTQN